MKDFVKDLLQSLYRFVTHRILWLFVLLVAAFYLLFVRLFELQIVRRDDYQTAPSRASRVTVSTPALRGEIFDRQGRPLAVNRLVYTVKMDPSVAISNEALYELALLFERNREDFVDDFPMTTDEPYAFTYPDTEGRARAEYRWKDDMTVANPETATAAEAFAYLRQQFGIDQGLSNAEARKILNFRCQIYMERLIYMEDYDPVPITLAYNVGPETVAEVEERNALFTGVFVEIGAQREYPAGEYFSHMLGYLGRITAEDFEANEAKGYAATDVFGRAGLERSMETYLRGKTGATTFEVDRAGQRLRTVAVTEPSPGGDVFLTTDLYLQQKAYDTLEDYLAQIIAAKLTATDSRAVAFTQTEIYTSLIESGNLDVNYIMDAGTDEARALRRYILERLPEAAASVREHQDEINTLLAAGVETGGISVASLLLAMIEAGQLTDPDGTLAPRLRSGDVTPRAVTVEKILSKELSPQMINLDPHSGSVVVLDAHNGDVLAAAAYPSYDNNRLVNNIDGEYLMSLYNDPTSPMVNRPFSEPLAPGSTLKMMTATAVLEAGAITPGTTVYDEHSFTKATPPHVDCWSAVSHGSVNVVQALQVSCNYFFCEAAFRLGNYTNGGTLRAIGILDQYMDFFGLNDRAGVEIGEHYDQYADEVASGELEYLVASPGFKRYVELSRDAWTPRSEWDWYDGDTVRAGMGQSVNAFTAAMMAKYVNVVANRGTRYGLHLVDYVLDPDGGIAMQTDKSPEPQELTVSDGTWDAVIEGMRLVTEGRGALTGTAVSEFEGFPIRVAGKTGTAQQSSLRPDHSSFAAFAPLENPEIVVYVNIPFGDSPRAFPHISALIAREMVAETLGLNRTAEPIETQNTLTQ